MQKIKIVQRNFSTNIKSLTETNVYETTPEKLRDFEDRLNSYTKEDWRVFWVTQEKINNATILQYHLIRDEW